MDYNFAYTLCDAARLAPSRPYVIDEDGQEYSFVNVEQLAARMAQTFVECGIQPGTRIGLRLPNSVDFIACYFAALSLGAVVFPLGIAASKSELEYIVDDAELVAIVVSSEDVIDAVGRAQLWRAGTFDIANGAERLRPIAVAQDSPAVVVYTSGSTGEPKGVELTHLNLLLGSLLGAATIGWGSEDVVYAVLPFYHVFGLSDLVNSAVVQRRTLLVRKRFSVSDFVDSVERYRVTYVPGVPTMFHALANVDTGGRDLSSIRTVCSGGAPMLAEQIDRVRATFPNANYTEGYGLTETGSLGTFNGYPFEFRHGSVGRAMQGVEIAVVGYGDQPLPPGERHVGEVLIRGPVVMKGYLGRPTETAAALTNGWLHTGDLGWVDDDGFLTIVGRSKDLIIRGGLNVHPREVEEVLVSHPLVAVVAVVGRPDDHYGEEIVAFVVPSDPSTPPAEDDLAELLDQRLAAYKHPRQFVIADRLPVGPTGKLDKRALKKTFKPSPPA